MRSHTSLCAKQVFLHDVQKKQPRTAWTRSPLAAMFIASSSLVDAVRWASSIALAIWPNDMPALVSDSHASVQWPHWVHVPAKRQYASARSSNPIQTPLR